MYRLENRKPEVTQEVTFEGGAKKAQGGWQEAETGEGRQMPWHQILGPRPQGWGVGFTPKKAL